MKLLKITGVLSIIYLFQAVTIEPMDIKSDACNEESESCTMNQDCCSNICYKTYPSQVVGTCLSCRKKHEQCLSDWQCCNGKKTELKCKPFEYKKRCQ